MNWFILFSLTIFIGVMIYLPVIRYFISPAYFEGLRVVPVVMMAELLFGIFFNLSLWYKLTDRTIWGTWFSLFGLAITLILNGLLVPRIGYMGCAWAALCCYGAMTAASYLVGRRLHPIPYNLRLIAVMFAGAFATLGLSRLVAELPMAAAVTQYVIPTALLLVFVGCGFVYLRRH